MLIRLCASARLAKKGNKSKWMEANEIHDDFERDSNFENDESEKKEHQPPPESVSVPPPSPTRMHLVKNRYCPTPHNFFASSSLHAPDRSPSSSDRYHQLGAIEQVLPKLIDASDVDPYLERRYEKYRGPSTCPPGMSERATCHCCSQKPAQSAVAPPEGRWTLTFWSDFVDPAVSDAFGARALYTYAHGPLLWKYEKKRASNADELEAWSNEMRKAVHNRQNPKFLRGFLVTLELEREQELGDAKEARRSEIKRRLGEMGWAEEDMNFGWCMANIRPKLIPLLEDNRERRLEMEREARRSERRRGLSRLFLQMREQSFPMLSFKAHNPMLQLSISEPVLDVSHRDAFPDFAHTLNWSIVKDIFETDATEGEMEVKFGQHRDEIRALITEWKDQVHTRLASSVRNAFEERNEPLRPTISVFNEEPDTLANISDNLKLLLRADSFFPPFRVVQPFKAAIRIYETPRELPTFNDIEWQARCVPSGDEESWVCVRLWKVSCSWIDVVGSDSPALCRTQTDLYQNSRGCIWFVKRGIVYNDVHDPELFTDKPMITDYATKALETGTSIVLSPSKSASCAKISQLLQQLLQSAKDEKKHLLDVHGIAEPKINEHYISRNWNNRLPGMDDSDSDDSYSMGYGGCSCPFHQMMGGLMYSDEEDEYGYEEDDGGSGLAWLGLGYSDDDDDDGDDMVDYWLTTS
ncbi:hypothetical protein RHS01_02286 [Rhizoctonia solani]|uniref:Uncharacterized protein n=1 Tax=Rhizoctonia solani TaxID=456999 RepID=A0A8H7M7N7_9AGAM|nr:hypothetical protein RHS01_02286 [Rhizoctonia solani]